MSETGTEPTGEMPTGVERVDGALESLRGLDGVPIEQHPAVFESVHGALRDVLNSDPDA
jgi:hypothetical protein